MKKELILLVRMIIAGVLLLNIPIYLMGYLFEGKISYILISILFSYVIYTLFIEIKYTIFNLILYTIGILLVVKRLYIIFIENDFIFIDGAIIDVLTFIVFIILIYLLLTKLFPIKEKK